ncbi:hypothetical protein CAPTEDRAFT_216827 [Capitella teleta]|uniref:Uncharacterized protein n=1 Tax=Capitella teleta TaxID=283909 RepID=R7USG6_CAPTE|nr:hypothetical protein CAPTEDRAFT_216827 [Capitella teleta]|eukprot:ELU09140.1 hypothetical protein CAPTEDRAFT_216827 [Capitella teleta]
MTSNGSSARRNQCKSFISAEITSLWYAVACRVPPSDAPGDARDDTRQRQSFSAAGDQLRKICRRYRVDPQLQNEIDLFVEKKKQLTMCETDDALDTWLIGRRMRAPHDAGKRPGTREAQRRERMIVIPMISDSDSGTEREPDETAWRDAIKRQLEDELDRRVREALETPPSPPAEESLGGEEDDTPPRRDRNRRATVNLTKKEKEFLQTSTWKTLQAKRRIRKLLAPQTNYEYLSDDDHQPPQLPNIHRGSNNQLPESEHQKNFHGIIGLYKTPNEVKSKSYYAKLSEKALANFGDLTDTEKHEFFYAFTRAGFKDCLGFGELADGSRIEESKRGKYKDKYGIIRDEHGPFWPPDYGPLHPAQEHKRRKEPAAEPLLPRCLPAFCDAP